MIYEFPDDTRDFKCIADRCADTCCAGWEVDIDEETAAWYRTVPGAFGDRLQDAMAVSPEDGSDYFPLEKNGRCPFLDDRNLCEIFSHLGEAALSRVCTEYPRYYVQIGDYEQIDMSLSCMEYGRIFFSAGPRKLTRAEDDIEDAEAEEIDNERLLRILDFRDWAVAYMQSGSGRWDARLRDIETEGLAIFGDSDSGREQLPCPLEKEPAGTASLECRAGVDGCNGEKELSNTAVTEAKTEHHGCIYGEESDESLLKRIASLEMIDGRWAETEQRVASYAVTFGEDAQVRDHRGAEEAQVRDHRGTGSAQGQGGRGMQIMCDGVRGAENARKGKASCGEKLEIWFTKLAVYFLFRYTIDIWYDGSADGVFRLVNRSLRYLYLMVGAEEKSRGRELETGDVADLAHRYSKQVEHAEENVAVMKNI